MGGKGGGGGKLFVLWTRCTRVVKDQLCTNVISLKLNKIRFSISHELTKSMRTCIAVCLYTYRLFRIDVFLDSCLYFPREVFSLSFLINNYFLYIFTTVVPTVHNAVKQMTFFQMRRNLEIKSSRFPGTF